MPETPWATRAVSRRAVLTGAGGAGLAALLAACSSSSTTASAPASGRSTAATSPTTTAPGTAAPATTSVPPTPTPTPKPATKVRVSSPIGDGSTVGVGMPVVLSFDPTPTDATAFVKAAKVSVNGTPVEGAWFWSHNLAGEPVQAHFRMQEYWPANSTVKVDLPIGGLSAGKGLVYRDELTSLSFRTGDKRVTTVDGKTLRAKVEVNDKVIRTMLVSLGAAKTPTFNGIKLVMQKGETNPNTGRLRPDGEVSMSDEAGTYKNDLVPWAVRITTSGEYLHAAAWNHHLGQYSSSNGCTNLSSTDGKWFYDFARIGDVVVHQNTDGGQVASWNGYADWNTPWATWVKGGLLSPV